MGRYLLFASLSAMTLVALGCAAPVAIIDYRYGERPLATTAPLALTYTLWTDHQRRIESTTLGVGEDVGFCRQGGELEAIAGDDRIPLAEGSYSWVIEQPRFHGFQGTGGRAAKASPLPRSYSGRDALGAIAAYSAATLILGTINAAAQ
jgi:hypothetical protein